MTNDDLAPIYIRVQIKNHIKNGDDCKRMLKESIRKVPKVFPDFKITFSILAVPFVLFTRKLCSVAVNRISEVMLYSIDTQVSASIYFGLYFSTGSSILFDFALLSCY